MRIAFIKETSEKDWEVSQLWSIANHEFEKNRRDHIELIHTTVVEDQCSGIVIHPYEDSPIITAMRFFSGSIIETVDIDLRLL